MKLGTFEEGGVVLVAGQVLHLDEVVVVRPVPDLACVRSFIQHSIHPSI